MRLRNNIELLQSIPMQILCYCKLNITYGLLLSELTVSIVMEYSPPDGFIPTSDTEYRAASGPVVATCIATGGIGSISYQWSSTCRDCPFQSSTSATVSREAVTSGDTGTHTCTAVDGGSGNTESASIVFNVVGE